MLTYFQGGLNYRRYLQNAVPSILSMVFLSFYTVIDGFFVSLENGPDALAAINIVLPIVTLIFGISVMLATGSAAIIGQALGSGRKRYADRIFSLILAVLLFLSVVFTFITLVFRVPITRILGTTDRLMPHVMPYYILIVLNTIPMALKLYFEYLVRTDGSPKVAMYMSVSGLILNIILDYFFVSVFKLGTLGAGMGTFFSILLSMFIGLFYFLFRSRLKFSRFTVLPGAIIKSITNGSSEMLSELSTGITTLLLNLVILRYYGEEGVAAVTVVMYVYYFFLSLFLGFSVSSAPLISFYYGAGDRKKIDTVMRYSLFTIAVSSILITFSCLAFASPMSSIFLDEGMAYDISVIGMRYLSLVFMTCGFNVFFSSYFTALSDGGSSALISSLRSLIFIVPAIVFLPVLLGSEGVWLSLAIADALTLVISIILYLGKGRSIIGSIAIENR